jgi:hypothetical protein
MRFPSFADNIALFAHLTRLIVVVSAVMLESIYGAWVPTAAV